VLNVDAGAYAQITETWKAQLNIENIFNKGYWASADGNNNISPGQPRTFRFKVTAKLRGGRLSATEDHVVV
jgi:catecholate siderophore receptor